MRRRHTKDTDADLAGPSKQRNVRIPQVQDEAIQAAIARGLPDIHSVTDAVIDALWLWLYENSQANGKPQPPPPKPPEPLIEAPEPPEADRPYTGTHDRPSWSDVDVAALGD